MATASVIDSSNREGVSYGETAIATRNTAHRATPDEILKDRMREISFVAHTALNDMQLSPIKKNFVLQFEMHKISISAAVYKKGNQIILRIPLLMLLRAEDFAIDSPFIPGLKKLYASKILSPTEKQEINSFLKIIENPEMAERAKVFMLYHEIAHIYHKHIDNQPENLDEYRELEKQADLTGALFSGDVEAAIYLFDIMKDCDSWAQDQSHPSCEERIKYLSERFNSKNTSQPDLAID